MLTVRYFHSLCEQIAEEPSLLVKQEIVGGFVRRFAAAGGDLALLFRLLLPKLAGRVYRIQDKQLIKLFSLLLRVPEVTLKDHLDQSGCIAITVRHFFRQSNAVPQMTLHQLDDYLESLAAMSLEDQQLAVLSSFLRASAADDIFVLLREIKHDLRLGAGVRTILSGLHRSAYRIFQRCANIPEVVRRVLQGGADSESAPSRSPSPVATTGAVSLGFPIAPMLAAPCRSVDQILSKAPGDTLCEVKYDGERIQIHKVGSSFSYFARSLKPMNPDKYEGLDASLRDAVKPGTIILDGEILVVDSATQAPLPFGTLGKHKRQQYPTANLAVVLFDVLFLDGRTLLDECMLQRRQLLAEAVRTIPSRVMLSECHVLRGSTREEDLQALLDRAISEGLEGLVIKDAEGRYSPGCRHWLKIKKDYLQGMADSADLIVLGAYYGKGANAGLFSAYLMGVRDDSSPSSARPQFKTVVRVGNGHTDATLKELTQKFRQTMTPLHGAQLPPWLSVHSSHVPDMVVTDPLKSDVWQITGAEFTRGTAHTASGISIRFPRIVKVRNDKDPASATTLCELESLLVASQAHQQPRPCSRSGTAPPARQLPQPLSGDSPPPCRSATAVPPLNPVAARLEHVVHPFVRPLCDVNQPHQNAVLAHAAALEGRWSERGVMGDIFRELGDHPKDAYNEEISALALGDVLFSEVSNRHSKARLFVATMIVQQRAHAPGAIPHFDNDAFGVAMQKCFAFAKKHDAALHVAQVDASTGIDWPRALAVLNRGASDVGRIVLYARNEAQKLQCPRIEAGTVAPCSSGSLLPLLPPVVQPDAFLSQFVVYIDASSYTPHDAKNAAQKFKVMGAAITESEVGATHVITELRKPGMTKKCCVKKWVDDCFAQRRLIDPHGYRPLSDVMKGCAVCICGLSDADSALLSQKITSLGGVVQEKWSLVGSRRCTHMVCTDWLPAAVRAFETGGAVVTPPWVEQSFEQQSLAPIAPYLLPPPFHLKNPEAPASGPPVGQKRLRSPAESPRADSASTETASWDG